MATMRMLRPAGYPANRAAGRWVLDVLLALLAGALWVPVLYNYNHEHTATHSPPGVGMIAVLALIVAPLVVRQIWPIAVFGVVAAACIGAALWDRGLVDWPALLIAVYTVAALRSRRAALVCAGLLETAVIVGLVLGAGRQWQQGAISYAGTVVAALGLGVLNKLLEGVAGAVLAKITVLVLIVIFIQRKPSGLFALKGRSAEA